MAFVPVDCLSIPVSSFDSFLLKREFSGEFLCLGVCAPPALEYKIPTLCRTWPPLTIIRRATDQKKIDG